LPPCFAPVNRGEPPRKGRDAHPRQLLLERLRARDRPWQLAVGKLARDVERAMADNWARVERAAENAAADREQRSSA
jgi:hypothetical protein